MGSSGSGSGGTQQSTGGGSQGSGKISYPAYLQNAHDDWIRHGDLASDGGDVDMEAAIYENWDASPYSQAFAYDPTDDVAAMHARFGTFDTYVGQLDPLTKFGDFMDAAAERYDALFDPTYIDDAVEAFSERQDNGLDRRIGRFSAGMADQGATMGSAYVIGVAMLYQDAQDEVNRFSRELTAQSKQERIQAISQWQGELRQHLGHQMQLQQAAAHMNGEIYRVGIVAQQESIGRDVEYAVQDRSWNLQLWQPGANLLASVAGGVSSGGSTTKGHDGSTPNSAIGGAITGGIGGAMAMAGVAPPFGAIAGGIMGALAGSQGGK
jgi:hypothetical protein